MNAMIKIDKKKYISTEEAARLLGLSVDSVRRYCNDKEPRIFAEKLGRDWFIPIDEIKKYQKERQKPGRPRN